MGNPSQQEKEREDKAGNPAPTFHSNRNQRYEENHSGDETDTTNVTTRERDQHERHPCDSIVQLKGGTTEPSQRKLRFMAFASFPRTTRAIDGPTWACEGSTLRAHNRRKGNETNTSESYQVLGNEDTMAPRTTSTIGANEGIQQQQQLKKTT